jgi:hypothetical protein
VLAVTESLGPVRGFELNSGRLLWLYQQPGCHILRIEYSEQQNAFFGVDWSYRRSGDKTLIRFDVESGQAKAVSNLGPSPATEFCLGGKAVVKSDGELIDVASGASLGVITREKEEEQPT